MNTASGRVVRVFSTWPLTEVSARLKRSVDTSWMPCACSDTLMFFSQLSP